jgi:hypothetical protein
VVCPASARVLRARTYSGATLPAEALAYATVTLCGAGFHTASAQRGRSGDRRAGRSRVVLQPRVRNGCSLFHARGLGCTRFARRYYGCGLLFLRLLRCFSWPGSRSASAERCQLAAGCPIRRSPDHSLHAAPRSISVPCPVLHRHAAPWHPSCAHHVFLPSRPTDRDPVTRCGWTHTPLTGSK